uniref:Uncharacterized protein n=1 Tax=Anguilla anguilla TaxID=7936 RepID=A0A0E9QCR0_ANGAN
MHFVRHINNVFQITFGAFHSFFQQFCIGQSNVMKAHYRSLLIQESMEKPLVITLQLAILAVQLEEDFG